MLDAVATPSCAVTKVAQLHLCAVAPEAIRCLCRYGRRLHAQAQLATPASPASPFIFDVMHPSLEKPLIGPASLHLVQPETNPTPSVYEHLFGCVAQPGDIAMLHSHASVDGTEELTPVTSVADSAPSASMGAMSMPSSLTSACDGGSGSLVSSQTMELAHGQASDTQVHQTSNQGLSLVIHAFANGTVLIVCCGSQRLDVVVGHSACRCSLARAECAAELSDRQL
jgi:hypothetical protein